MSVLIFNEIDQIYSDGILESDGEYICSVCRKSYKTKVAAEKHYTKKECHDYVSIFRDTHVENNLYLLYTEILSLYYPKSVVSKNVFRKSPRYTIMCKFYLMCIKDRICMTEYSNYILKNMTRGMNPFALISKYTKKSMLNDFMVYRRFNRNDTDSFRFFEKHEQTLNQDDTFVLRTIQRGDINVSNLFQYMDFECFVDRLTDSQKVVLRDLLEPHSDSIA